MSILVTMTEQKRLEIGDQAPACTLPNDSGETTSLADYQGKRVLVYFYPRANTPGCTTEACDFRDSLTQLNDMGIEVVGISPDTVDKLVTFREKNNLTFPLLADPDKNVLKEWGAFGEKKNYGKIVEGVIRSTFLVDTDGTIELALYNVRATGHVARVIRELEK